MTSLRDETERQRLIDGKLVSEFRKMLTKEVDEKLADIGGCVGLESSFVNQYITIGPQLASFDSQTVLLALALIDDHEKRNQFIEIHQKDLESFLQGRFGVERTGSVGEFPLKIQGRCSHELATYLNGLMFGMKTKDHSLYIEPEWKQNGVSLVGHSNRTSRYLVVIGQYVGLNRDEIGNLHDVGLLHDFGKTQLNDEILQNKGSLSDREWRYMKKHPSLGADVIRGIATNTGDIEDRIYLERMREVIWAHHEWYEGSKGYPRHLKAEEIPKTARMLAIADAFDAMTSDRPYSRRKDLDYIRREILDRRKGTQFDPELCEEGVFEALVSASKEFYQN